MAMDLQMYLFNTEADNITVVVRSEECQINTTVVVTLAGVWAAHEDDDGQLWREFGFVVDDTELAITLGEDVKKSLTFTRSWEDLDVCSSVGVEFIFPPTTRLARNCTGWNNNNKNCTHYSNTVLTDFYDLDSGDFDGSRTRGPNYSGDHIIFIPLGAILFVVTVCLRFCLCPKRGVIASSRSISAVRRQLSLHSEAGDSSTTMNYDLDLPPAYSELQNEETPPPYSEIEKVRLQPYGETPPPPPPPMMRRQSSTVLQVEPSTHQITTDTTLGDTERSVSSQSSADSSAFVKVLTSRPKTLQSQFSHKPLEEEKPSEEK